jgi:hypothetical protein
MANFRLSFHQTIGILDDFNEIVQEHDAIDWRNEEGEPIEPQEIWNSIDGYERVMVVGILFNVFDTVYPNYTWDQNLIEQILSTIFAEFGLVYWTRPNRNRDVFPQGTMGNRQRHYRVLLCRLLYEALREDVSSPTFTNYDSHMPPTWIEGARLLRQEIRSILELEQSSPSRSQDVMESLEDNAPTEDTPTTVGRTTLDARVETPDTSGVTDLTFEYLQRLHDQHTQQHQFTEIWTFMLATQDGVPPRIDSNYEVMWGWYLSRCRPDDFLNSFRAAGTVQEAIRRLDDYNDGLEPEEARHFLIGFSNYLEQQVSRIQNASEEEFQEIRDGVLVGTDIGAVFVDMVASSIDMLIQGWGQENAIDQIWGYMCAVNETDLGAEDSIEERETLLRRVIAFLNNPRGLPNGLTTSERYEEAVNLLRETLRLRLGELEASGREATVTFQQEYGQPPNNDLAIRVIDHILEDNTLNSAGREITVDESDRGDDVMLGVWRTIQLRYCLEFNFIELDQNQYHSLMEGTLSYLRWYIFNNPPDEAGQERFEFIRAFLMYLEGSNKDRLKALGRQLVDKINIPQGPAQTRYQMLRGDS